MEPVSEIVPGLFVSDAPYARGNAAAYELVVNCTGDIPFAPDVCHGLRLPVRDDARDADALLHCLQDTRALDVIDGVLCSGRKVLVHCWMGIQRSPAVAACYLVRYRGSTPNEAIAWLRAQRLGALQPFVNFEATIRSMASLAA